MCRFDNFSMGKKCTFNNFSVGKRVQNKQKKVKSCHLLSNKKGSDMTMSPLYDWKYVTCYILHYSISSQDQQQNLARNHDHVCHVSLTFPDSINFENWVWFVIYLLQLVTQIQKVSKVYFMQFAESDTWIPLRNKFVQTTNIKGIVRISIQTQKGCFVIA